MPSPLADHIDTIAALYAPPSGYFVVEQQTAGICWAIRQVGNEDRVIFRGSVDVLDWWHDLTSEVSRVVPGYPSVGHVPYGFGGGLLPAYQAIRQALRPGVSVYAEGHSLGGAHASAIAGMALADGLALAGIVLCGCPKPGMLPLTALIKSSNTPLISLHNGDDPVPNVPKPMWPLLEWRDAGAIMMVRQAPTGAPISEFERLIPDAAWHNIALYQAAARVLGSAVTI